MVSFDHLGLSAPVLRAISELGFETPSEIQAQAIPQLIEGDQDFIGLAQTGTGKTAAFGLPLLERIDPNAKHTQALILAPTRELGQQIAQQLGHFSKYLDRLNVLAVYGGANIMTQINALKRPQHVIIATPGRLIDLIKRKAVRLDRLEYLILDEADEMLTMGFKEEVDRILSYTPEERNIWLFSATMSADITRIVRTYMENPFEVKLNTRNEVNANISHQFAVVRRSDKLEALVRFLDVNPEMRGVVFCRTKRDTQNLAEDLLKKDYKADALHGDLSQHQRDRVMGRFKNHELQVLIATDVAARGIDVNDLTHVFHFSLPDDLSYYTHRSGRTARAGKKGTSIAFVNGREKYRVGHISKSLGISFEQVMIPSAEEIYDMRIKNWAEKIMTTNVKGKIEKPLWDKLNLFFANLSKEELLAKVVASEMGKLQVNSHKDLNDIQIYKKDRDDRRGGDRRGGGRREGRPYNGNRNRSNGSSDGYKPNKKSKKRRQKKKKF
ncbi:MAG: DEAD/DEAH box helicase [Bacteroidota bacterium]